jgi:hypothetical protein
VRPVVILFGLAMLACSDFGTPWQPIDTAGVTPRWGHVALHDRARDRMLVLGGETEDDGPIGDVLALDLATLAWSPVATTSAPEPRTDFAALIDAPRDRVIVIGGRRGLATSVPDVSALDLGSGAWSTLPTGPSARHDVSAVTDGVHAWIFGGAGDFLQSLDDLWELDLASDAWRLLPAGTTHPSARTSYAIALADGAIWIHGGHDATTPMHDTWRYLLDEGRWERVEPAGNTVAAAHFGFGYDPHCNALVTTGGDDLDQFDVSFTDALVLDPAAPRFERMHASVMPPPRDHASLMIDEARRRMILFGGGRAGDGLGTRSDAWMRALDECP